MSIPPPVTWFMSTSRSWDASQPVAATASTAAAAAPTGAGIGDDYLHAAVEDHSRLAYVELLDDERDQSCAGFWRRAQGSSPTMPSQFGGC
jgi:hypothetical protein